MTYTLFCGCTKIGKNLNDEYEKVLKELQKYTDIIKLSFNLFDLEKIKEVVIEKGISENWISKSKIVYINQLPIIEPLNKDSSNEIISKLLKENILNNNNMTISKIQNDEDIKNEAFSLFKKTKINENNIKKTMNAKHNYCSEDNVLDENKNQENNDKNEIKKNDNKNNNSIISSLYSELKSSSVISSADLK